MTSFFSLGKSLNLRDADVLDDASSQVKTSPIREKKVLPGGGGVGSRFT